MFSRSSIGFSFDNYAHKIITNAFKAISLFFSFLVSFSCHTFHKGVNGPTKTSAKAKREGRALDIGLQHVAAETLNAVGKYDKSSSGVKKLLI